MPTIAILDRLVCSLQMLKRGFAVDAERLTLAKGGCSKQGQVVVWIRDGRCEQWSITYIACNDNDA